MTASPLPAREQERGASPERHHSSRSRWPRGVRERGSAFTVRDANVFFLPRGLGSPGVSCFILSGSGRRKGQTPTRGSFTKIFPASPATNQNAQIETALPRGKKLKYFIKILVHGGEKAGSPVADTPYPHTTSTSPPSLRLQYNPSRWLASVPPFCPFAPRPPSAGTSASFPERFFARVFFFGGGDGGEKQREKKQQSAPKAKKLRGKRRWCFSPEVASKGTTRGTVDTLAIL